MSDTATLIVSTFESRVEVEVPLQFLEDNDMPRVTSFLRESEIDIPNTPMLTKNNSAYMLHEVPEFG